MQPTAATLNTGGDEPDQRAANAPPPQRPGGGAMKFAYQSGARPLEGYTIKRGIGIGGFGEVYFATSDAGKEVALKRVQRHLEVEIRGVTQCLNLKHANLIGLFDIRYDDQGEAWVVMEYVNGETLKDALDRNPHGLPLEQVRLWFLGIAAGVNYLHDHGIVHRDLKPGNVFLDEDIVKIGDYGLAKFISCSRRSGQTESVGTFHYMAPEIGKGVYGKEIDVYALGVLLYEMITGCVPFDGESSQEIIMKHLTAEPDLSDVAQPYRNVIQQALQKDPAKRTARVTDMLAALDLESGHIERLEAPSPVAAEVVPEAPPVRKETIYIGDDPIDEGIELGPVKDVVPAQSVESRPRPTTPRVNNSPSAQPNEEPIAHAVGAGGRRVATWWQNSGLSTPVKVLLVIGVVLLAVLSTQVWAPIVVALAFAYLVYLAVRGLILAVGGSNSASAATASGAAVGRQQSAQGRRRQASRRKAWKVLAREQMRKKPSGQRLSELTGSLLMSAMVAIVVCLVMMVLGGKPLDLDGSVDTWSFFAWLAVTAASGAWMTLIASKFWEGDDGEQAMRRFVMLVLGLLLGAGSFGLNTMLMVNMPDSELLGVFPADDFPPTMFDGATPLLPGYLAFFAGMFLLLCWWKQADPLRATRFSLWKTIVASLWGFILPFPQPCGVMLAATISIAVQLSAPWMGPRERTQLRRQHQVA